MAGTTFVTVGIAAVEVLTVTPAQEQADAKREEAAVVGVQALLM